MEKQLAPSLKARAADVAALSPRKVTPTKKGLSLALVGGRNGQSVGWRARRDASIARL